MRYVEVIPREPLDRLVRCFWFLEGNGAPGPTRPEPVLPDGSPELIFNLADPFQAHHGAGTRIRQPRAMLVGQIIEPLLLGPTGRIDLIGVRFQPNGVVGLWGEISTLTGRWIPVDELPRGSRLRGLWQSLGNEPSVPRRAALLDTALSQLMTPPPRTDSRVEAAVRAIRQSHGRVSISGLVRNLNTSTRNLERSFSEQVGLPPKLLARITRFQRVFTALRDGMEGWAAVAIRCGYYDQSHLVRDFREFAGYPPAAFLAEQPEFTSLFTGLQQKGTRFGGFDSRDHG